MASKKTCACSAKHPGPCVCPKAGCEFPAGHETPCGKRIAPRTPEAIANDYARAAAELGDAVYRRDIGLPRLISDLEKRMADLNEESASLNPTPKETPNHG